MMTYRMVRTHPTPDELPLVFGGPAALVAAARENGLVATRLMNSLRPASCFRVVTLRGNGE